MSLFQIREKKKDNGNPFIQVGQYTDEELPIAEIIQRRRIQVLIHSKLYYDMDTSLITDKQFDEWGRELVKLQRDYPNIAKRICYAEAFKDWDASTGAFLPLQDPWVTRKAQQLLKINQNMKGETINMNTRKYSKNQESRVAKTLKGKRQANSGVTPFLKVM